MAGKELNKAEDFQKIGEHYYKLAVTMEENNGQQSKINAAWEEAATNYYQAFSLGEKKAAISLFKCFGQGVGVPQDTEVATLMYGVAKSLTPEKCDKIPSEHRPLINEATQKKVDILTKLVKDTQPKIPASGISMEEVENQMKKFDNALKPLISGKSIEQLLTQGMEGDQLNYNNIETHNYEPMEYGNHPNDDGLNHVDVTGEGSSSCFKCTIM